MGNRSNNRRNSNDDDQAVEYRRAAAEDRPARRTFNAADQIVDNNELVQACTQVLLGEPGEYPVFGAFFSVEKDERGQEGDFLLRFHGAVRNCELSGMVRPGFFVKTWQLKQAFRDAAKRQFSPSNDDAGAILAHLLSQAEVHEALAIVKQQQEEDQALRRGQYMADAQKRVNDLAGAHAPVKVITTPPPAAIVAPTKRQEPPVLAGLAEVLIAPWGLIEHSGVTMLACKGKPVPGGVPPIVIRVQSTTEGHEFADAAAERVFVFQNQLPLAEKNEVEFSGKAKMARQFRVWLRAELRAIGALPAETAPTDGVDTMSGVNAEHEGAATLAEEVMEANMASNVLSFVQNAEQESAQATA